MRKKIIIALSLFSLLFLLAGVYIITEIEQATTKVDNLIRLHRIEILREHLLIKLKKAQADLYLRNTRYASSVDTVVTHVRVMDTALENCYGCHHSPEASEKLDAIKKQFQQYKSALSRLFTLRANRSRLEEEEDTAFKLGATLISDIDDITTMTNRKLEDRTRAALTDIAQTKKILYLLLVIVPLMALSLSVLFFRSFTKPVDALLIATRQLKAGDLDYRIKKLQDEYGEVAASFNEMASSLREHALRMQWAEQVVVLGEMAGGLAHEMRNPIAGIKGSIEVICGNAMLSEQNKEILLKVIEQIDRIEFLVKNLLNFAQPPKPALLFVDINEVFKDTISLAEKHPLFLSKPSRVIHIVRAFDPNLPKTMADPIQLQQVFMNLLLNASDAMPKGGTLTVQTFCNQTSPWMHVTVKDTGIGIDESMIHKVFLPFFTTKPKGTGLGLSITKRLIEQHGGQIRVVNNIEGGVTFTVDLPIKPEEASV